MVSLLMLLALASSPRAPTDTSPAWSDQDWRIFAAKVRWGVSQGLDRLPLGAAIARLGESFVGTKYTPATLEAPGPEHIVINLHELDCVTFVENVLALTRFIRHDGLALLASPKAAQGRYGEYLMALRYRGGVLDGYPSRLHYFSEWLADNERRGSVRQISRELGGVEDSEPIDFMSTHAKSYRQLVDPGALERIRGVEAALNRTPGRWFIPKDRIEAIATKIQEGDIIAATSTVKGLDVAHTGIAVWDQGALHLVHAPLVGKSVEISALPLAERIQGIRSQDGIMVARPIDQR